jgi:hypothetical protein
MENLAVKEEPENPKDPKDPKNPKNPKNSGVRKTFRKSA